MYYFKNISLDVVDLGGTGADVEPGASRAFNDVGQRDDIADQSGDINKLIYAGLIVIMEDDRELSKDEGTQVVSNNYNKVVIGNPEVINNSVKSLYYFVRDRLTIRRGYRVIKHFKGRVESMYIIPSNSNLDVSILTGDGLLLPTENLVKRQTLELDFKGKVRDIEVSIEADTSSATVEIFMDGYATVEEVKELQDFIDTWNEDHHTWGTGEIIVKTSYNNNKLKTDIINNSDLGNTFIINSNYNIGVGKEFGIFQHGSSTLVEYLEWNQWSAWNPREFRVWLKNVRYIKFNDRIIDITDPAYTLVEYRDRKDDGRYY